MKPIFIEAIIRWKDNGETQDVTFCVGTPKQVNNDDDIFYYLDTEEEFKLGFTDFEVITIND